LFKNVIKASRTNWCFAARSSSFWWRWRRI